jgi:hypothetical protein
MKPILGVTAVAIWTCVSGTIAAQTVAVDLDRTLARAGERVAAFFTRAQSLVCTELVTMQPLSSSLTADGFSRTVESELRISWDPTDEGPATEAQLRRQVLKVNGRPPRPKDRGSCTTPEHNDTETQALSMLLPQQRDKYEFAIAGAAQVDGRDSVMVDFREIAKVSADVKPVEGLEDCISYDLTGGQRGRVWIDRETFDVLRLDQRLVGMIDLRMPRVMLRRPGAATFLTLERADSSMRFARIAFAQPDESLLLPSVTTELRIVRGASRLRTMTKYLNYKRFLTGSRVVG